MRNTKLFLQRVADGADHYGFLAKIQINIRENQLLIQRMKWGTRPVAKWNRFPRGGVKNSGLTVLLVGRRGGKSHHRKRAAVLLMNGGQLEASKKREGKKKESRER